MLYSKCYKCGKESEDVNHLFLHCHTTDQIVAVVLTWWGLNCLYAEIHVNFNVLEH